MIYVSMCSSYLWIHSVPFQIGFAFKIQQRKKLIQKAVSLIFFILLMLLWIFSMYSNVFFVESCRKPLQALTKFATEPPNVLRMLRADFLFTFFCCCCCLIAARCALKTFVETTKLYSSGEWNRGKKRRRKKYDKTSVFNLKHLLTAIGFLR